MKPPPERHHDIALAQHDRRWAEMSAVARKYGRASPEYTEARQCVIDAAAEVRRVAQRIRTARRWGFARDRLDGESA